MRAMGVTHQPNRNRFLKPAARNLATRTTQRALLQALRQALYALSPADSKHAIDPNRDSSRFEPCLLGLAEDARIFGSAVARRPHADPFPLKSGTTLQPSLPLPQVIPRPGSRDQSRFPHLHFNLVIFIRCALCRIERQLVKGIGIVNRLIENLRQILR